ncbi:cob(I)yrinic acid a,c-diamide adenosyltransferase [Halosquirtibacter xylanolyticus]|uniref:cob(I)yrinic acid a,c-diamide adenosyltransferase n=1 Tax=Halosquirtibacter xylanolyticus TaxID=3374599 RepID=UPI0037491BB8|nr:cob(I)yrinic acid a,c-diamide adenosyltransferase [Prolixibacteraceae bacterium]
MKVYTKTGDKGKTSLFGGTRVDKFDPRLEAYGTIDELNSYVGMVRSFVEKSSMEEETLIEIQKKLFVIGGVLATDEEKIEPSKRLICEDDDIKLLENEIDRMDESLIPLEFFILPGGEQGSSFCHLARTVCRRSERLVLKLSKEIDVQENVLKYLNRLSDYMFVLSRYIAHQKNVKETPWIP